MSDQAIHPLLAAVDDVYKAEAVLSMKFNNLTSKAQALCKEHAALMTTKREIEAGLASLKSAHDSREYTRGVRDAHMELRTRDERRWAQAQDISQQVDGVLTHSASWWAEMFKRTYPNAGAEPKITLSWFETAMRSAVDNSKRSDASAQVAREKIDALKEQLRVAQANADRKIEPSNVVLGAALVALLVTVLSLILQAVYGGAK